MNCKRYIGLALGLAFTVAAAAEPAQKKSFWSELEYEVNAGTNIGGASPLPLPAEIRGIESFSPNLNLQLGATVTKWIDKERKWGVALGLRFETKGMDTRARVKNYGMEIWQDGEMLNGRWTGKVKTKYATQQLVLPITGVWQANRRLKVNFGPYLAYAFKNDFDGYVYEGYLRVTDPTGDKVSFKGDSRATYDFSEDLRRFQWGLQGGVSWAAYKHLMVNANLAWGCNDVFKKSFKTISFAMYPIYLNLGFGYRF